MKLSLSFKLLIGLSLLIIGMITSVSYFNSQYIKEMILKRERDFNLTIVESRNQELDYYLEKRQAELKQWALELYNSDLNKHLELNPKFDEVPELISVELFSLQSQTIRHQMTKTKFAKNSEIDSLWQIQKKKYLEQLKKESSRFFVANSSEIFKEISNANFSPTLTFFVPFSQQNGQLDIVIIATVDAKALIKMANSIKVGELFITNNFGEIIASTNERLQRSLAQKIYDKQFTFANAYPLSRFSGIFGSGEETSVVSFVKNRNGLFVFNQVPTSVLLAPAELVVLTTFRISGYFLAASIFLLFLFSLNITRSLEKIAFVTLEIARGNFNHDPTKFVKQIFKDEVHTLTKAVDTMLKGLKERDRFKTLFNKFHGSAVTEDLMNNEIALRGEKRNVFVFFSDLRGFTKMSENRDPSQVVEMLNEYFSYMVPAINDSGGVVDKFIGDAIMAVWGVPKSDPENGKNALTACLKMRTTLNELNTLRRVRGEEDLWIGMGLHYGEAISGTIGSLERMEYTVIGNTINTASRIEASTKAFGTDLLVSEEVYEQLKEHFMYELAGQVEVKGRSEPLKLYKVNGLMTEDKNEIPISTPFSSYTPEGADKVKVVA